MTDGDVSQLYHGDHIVSEVTVTSGPGEDSANDRNQDALPKEHKQLSRISNNPALEIKTKVTLDIEPFPGQILQKINPDYSFRPTEKDGELVVPIVCLFKCVWEGLATTVEEKDSIWCGAEHGKTAWVNAKRMGAFPTPANEKRVDSNAEVPVGEESKSATIERYVASLVDAGDNHITLLTAAYCVLFDQIWGYILGSTVSNIQPSFLRKDSIDAFDLCRTSPYHGRYRSATFVASRTLSADSYCQQRSSIRQFLENSV
jgi:hypothetical protein